MLGSLMGFNNLAEQSGNDRFQYIFAQRIQIFNVRFQEILTFGISLYTSQDSLYRHPPAPAILRITHGRCMPDYQDFPMGKADFPDRHWPQYC